MRPHFPAFLWALAILIVALMSTMALVFFLFRSELPDQSTGISTPASFVVRDLELIKGQMNLLITGSMEAKFAQLESSLKSGIISRKDLATLKELKENLSVLKAYSVQNSQAMVIGPAASAPTFAIDAPASLYSDQVLHEIGNIRQLFYISMISWGGLILVIGGTWLRSHYRFRELEFERHRQPLLDRPGAEFN